jgi:hypothetical protein
MDIALFIPILRQILQVFGGYLIAHGVLDDGASDALIGLGVNGATFAWWLYDRWRINRHNAELKQIAGIYK